MTTPSTTCMSSFTCMSCRVAFKDAETQRLHHKTDWHRYNLKRKVAELPPVTAEEFEKRVLQQRSLEENNYLGKTVYCQVCRKNFTNEKAYNNHIQSKKHQDGLRNFTKDDEKETKTDDIVDDTEILETDSDDDDEDEENPIDNNNCLFCLHHSKTLIKNLKHMSTEHSFFIPDVEYCTDIKGLLSYLGDKITQGYMCIWCNEKGKTFYSADAARNHMLDKGHCKMLHEGLALAEYVEFYDYSSSYPDADNKDVDDTEEVEVPEIDGSEYQLVLPSGITVGHRSLMRYYKQNPNPDSAVVPRRNKRLHKVLAQYRALGWNETQQEAAAKKARDIHYMKRAQAKWNMKLGMKNNKIKQHHFRPQINY